MGPGDDDRAGKPERGFDATVVGADASLGHAGTVVRKPGVVLAAGTSLAGRYAIGELLGQGGMGTVYAARDADLDEDIALKLLRPDLARDASYRARLRAEVRLARRVSHPNVCRVHDLGIAGELVFVTMELVHGRTLRHLLAEMRAQRLAPFDLAQIVDILVQLGSALSAAHRSGVIHRDVKPDNAMLADTRVVLTDFGIATHTTDQPDQVAGTPAYLAPEVVLHAAFDHRVDVYALAVVAYELIAGTLPFPVKTLDAAIEVAASRPPYPPLPESFGTPAVRYSIDRVLKRGLAFDPDARLRTVDQLTEAFAIAARGDARTALASVPAPAGVGELTPPPSVRGTDVGVVRRPEVRVATAFAWRRDDRDVAATEAVERLVADAGGVPIRVVGGDIIAIFGAPRSLGDDAERAARAALAAVERHGGRAGLDATRVMLRPGSAELAGPEVAAGAVALAARDGEVVASAAASRQLAARFELAPAGDGKRVLGGAPAPRRSSYRARELAAVEAHLELAFHERRPVYIELRGATGAGKTRLREALIASVSARREVAWLVAASSPVGVPIPFATVRAASSSWYDAIAAASDAAQRTAAARRWLEAQSSARPVVVVIEDVQWADPSTRALLDDLRASLEGVPIAIVTLLRVDDPAHAPAPAPGAHVVALEPLDDASAGELATRLAPNASPATIADIVARAAGNPYFVEELARELAEARPGDTIVDGAVPVSIEAVIQARLDHLPEAARQVALAAAVVGRAFWRSAVAAVVELADAELDAALAELERRGIVAALPPVTIDDDRYRFAQPLVRDVAYARSPPRERRAHHATIATWLEQRGAERRDDLPLALEAAYHREQAGDRAGAAFAYRRAGARCVAVYANAEATAALRRAVALTDRPDAALHEELGDAIAETAGPAAAEESYLAADAALASGDVVGRARLAAKLGYAAARRGDQPTAVGRFRAGLALVTGDGGALAPWAQADPRIAAQLHGGLGWTLGYLMARVDEGHPHCERAVALLEGTPYRRELAFALSRLGGTYMRACRFADQLRTNQRNLEIARELGDFNMQMTAHVNLGVVHGVLGAIDDAVAATVAAHQLAVRTGATATIGLALSNLGGLLVDQGHFAEARAALDEALAVLARTGQRYVMPETFAFQARVAAADGDLVGARHHAERSRALARELGSELDVAVATRLLAQIASRAGDHARARTLVDEALAAASAIDELETIRTRAARSRVLRAAGDPAAEATYDEVRGQLERLGVRRELAVLADVREVR